ncbi:hypothetical protein FOA52_000373 [Chlamydomonas sp. UWO 241]|nr:hypothetical protein FOA52_000373 [Chlamydomonas sp. UWO 241]
MDSTTALAVCLGLLVLQSACVAALHPGLLGGQNMHDGGRGGPHGLMSEAPYLVERTSGRTLLQCPQTIEECNAVFLPGCSSCASAPPGAVQVSCLNCLCNGGAGSKCAQCSSRQNYQGCGACVAGAPNAFAEISCSLCSVSAGVGEFGCFTCVVNAGSSRLPTAPAPFPPPPSYCYKTFTECEAVLGLACSVCNGLTGNQLGACFQCLCDGGDPQGCSSCAPRANWEGCMMCVASAGSNAIRRLSCGICAQSAVAGDNRCFQCVEDASATRASTCIKCGGATSADSCYGPPPRDPYRARNTRVMLGKTTCTDLTTCLGSAYSTQCFQCMAKPLATREDCFKGLCYGVPAKQVNLCLDAPLDARTSCFFCMVNAGVVDQALIDRCVACAKVPAAAAASCVECILDAPPSRIDNCTVCNDNIQNMAGCHACVSRSDEPLAMCEVEATPPPPPPPPPPPYQCFRTFAQCGAQGNTECGVCAPLVNDTDAYRDCLQCVCEPGVPTSTCLACVNSGINGVATRSCLACLLGPTVVTGGTDASRASAQGACVTCADSMNYSPECYRCVGESPQGRALQCPACRFVDFYPPAFCFSCVRDGQSAVGNCIEATGFAPQRPSVPLPPSPPPPPFPPPKQGCPVTYEECVANVTALALGHCGVCDGVAPEFQSQCWACVCVGTTSYLCAACAVQPDAYGCYGCLLSGALPGPDAQASCVTCSFQLGLSDLCYVCVLASSVTDGFFCPACLTLSNPASCIACLNGGYEKQPERCLSFGPPPPPIRDAPFVDTVGCMANGLAASECKACGLLGSKVGQECFTCIWKGSMSRDCTRCAYKPTEGQRIQCTQCLIDGGLANSCDSCSDMMAVGAAAVCIDCSKNPAVIAGEHGPACIQCANGPSPDARAACAKCVMAHPYNTNTCVACMGFFNPNITWAGPDDTSIKCFTCMDRDFVNFFRRAGPYIQGHAEKTFVCIVPGEVTSDPSLLRSTLDDLTLLHGLGVRLVIVTGAGPQIDASLVERGLSPAHLRGYRLTDKAALECAVVAAGHVRSEVESGLSHGPTIPVIRRHTKGTEGEMHFGPGRTVVSGNYVAAKRRGVIDGVDHGRTGEVRFVMADAIRQQLDCGNIVLLSHLGFSAGGEVLNCSAYDVGLAAAAGLHADKLLVQHTGGGMDGLALPAWLPLGDAQQLLTDALSASARDPDGDPATASAAAALLEGGGSGSPAASRDAWAAARLPPCLGTAVAAAMRGIVRAHVVDARLPGSLVCELYSAEGVGTMVSADFYSGMRQAGREGDAQAVAQLLAPLARSGMLSFRTEADIAADISTYHVVEVEGRVVGAAQLVQLGDGVGEIGAFVMDERHRQKGRGDSLLDYMEQAASASGVSTLVTMLPCSADWFEHRGFAHGGHAWESSLLSPERRAIAALCAPSAPLYTKALSDDADGRSSTVALRPGKRIGCR